jgi:cold shock CspA family protein
LNINPKPSGASAKVGIENLKPGQKIKVVVKEGKKVPSPAPSVKASSKATPKPNSSKNNFKVTTKEPVKVVPKPSGSKANVGVSNLKPGQKIKVTVKTGGKKK